MLPEWGRANVWEVLSAWLLECQETGSWQAGCRSGHLSVLEPLLGLELESAKTSLPQGRAYQERGTDSWLAQWDLLPAASICSAKKGNSVPWWPCAEPWRLCTHPSHVTDTEDSVDDVLINVGRDKLHLDGPITPGGLLRPVLHTELQKRKEVTGVQRRGHISAICHGGFLVRRHMATKVQS